MIRYFCDLCKEEMERKQQHYTYILPRLVPYEAMSVLGEPIYTYEQLEDKEVDICNACREKISQALKKIEVREKS